MSWNIGNTTVRNPARIQAGLRLLAREFNGDIHGKVREKQFWDRLTEEEIVRSKPKKEPDLDGRKWRSCFCKLGFITDNKYEGVNGKSLTLKDLQQTDLGLTGRPYELTPIGQRLIQATTLATVEDIFFRQLLRLETPSPTEELTSEKVKPLILVLQILYGLQQIGADGLSKAEIAAFLQTAPNHQGIQVRLQRILEYRKIRDSKNGKVAKRGFDRETIEAQRKTFHPKTGSLVDYADTTFRYSRLTGLLSLQGSRIVIRPEKFPIIEKLLETEPQFLAECDPLAYLVDFYTGTELPTDKQEVALEEIRRYENELQKYNIKPIVVTQEAGKTVDPQRLQDVRFQLEEQVLVAKETTFASEHAKDKSLIDDIIKYLEAVTKRNPDPELGIDEKSAYLEWAVWRALLTMNSLAEPVYKTRNFDVDSDLRPTGNAKSRVADIVMYYKDFLLVTEVTLLTTSRQYSLEGEPVLRHVYHVVRQQDENEVYGLFIAPAIDPMTAREFRSGIWIEPDSPDVEHRVSVVPLTIKQLIAILKSMKKVRRTTGDFRELIAKCLETRDTSKPNEWLQQISANVETWVSA